MQTSSSSIQGRAKTGQLRVHGPELPVQMRQAVICLSLAVILCLLWAECYAYDLLLSARLAVWPFALSIAWFLANGRRLTHTLLSFLVGWITFEWFFSYGYYGYSLGILLVFCAIELKLWQRDANFPVTSVGSLLYLMTFLGLLVFAHESHLLLRDQQGWSFSKENVKAVYKAGNLLFLQITLLYAYSFFRQRFSRSSSRTILIVSLPLLLLYQIASLTRWHEYKYAQVDFSLHPHFTAGIIFLHGWLLLFSLSRLLSGRHKLPALVATLAIVFSAAYSLDPYVLNAEWNVFNLWEQIRHQDTLDTLMGHGSSWKDLFTGNRMYSAKQYPLSSLSVIALERGLIFVILIIFICILSYDLLICSYLILACFLPLFLDPLCAIILAFHFSRAERNSQAVPLKTASFFDLLVMISGLIAICLSGIYIASQGYMAYQTYVRGPRHMVEKREYELPESFVRNLLAAEDILFFHHNGIDFSRLKRTVLETIKYAEFARGGSTITMQLAKIQYLSYEKSIARKVQQIWLSLILESVLSKEQILQQYLSIMSFADGVSGLEQAALDIFGKHPPELDEIERIKLILSIPDPAGYNARMPLGDEQQDQLEHVRFMTDKFRNLLSLPDSDKNQKKGLITR